MPKWKSVDKLTKPSGLTDEEWQGLAASVDDASRIRENAKEHVQRYLATNGEDGYTMEGVPLPVMLLTTIGRKSGNHVTAPVNFHKQNGVYYAVGSMAGHEKDPNWASNLKKTAKAWLQDRAEKCEVKVELLTGEKRKAMWPVLVGVMPLWGVFQERAEREFPVFELTPLK